MQQTIGSGLTALDIIRCAMKIAPDFSWAKIALLLPQDARNVLSAFQTVGNNPYYGFKQDLGIVKSTNYKSFSYVSKELCKKFGGPTYSTIEQYRGWTKNPLHKQQLDLLIEEYTPNTENIEDPDILAEQVPFIESLFTASRQLDAPDFTPNA